jgi:oligoendopeptidase F
MLKKRNQIEKKYRWNIEAMYGSDGDWEADFARAEKLATEFGSFSGKLKQDGKTLLAAFRAMDKVWQLTERVYVYARMRRDEDNGNSVYQALADRAHGLMARVAAAMSFFSPEFLALPGATLARFRRETAGLKGYDHVIDVLLRHKAHVLSKKEEALLAELREPLSATGEIFTMLNDADMIFGEIKDEKGVKQQVTHGNYIRFLECGERKVRKAAYTAVYTAYGKQRNTLAATYGYNTKTDAASARVRKYDSALKAALAADDVPVSVYDNLIDSVGANLDVLHRYLDIRRRVLGLSRLQMYDVYVPLFRPKKERYNFEEALVLMERGLAPLGEDYRKHMMAGVESGWIDIYENEGKTSGAYSFGSYDSMPYILMNFEGRLNDVFTLVHEMGHSMHAFYTRSTQPFRYGDHSIFTAEVASTVNESLLMRHLLDNSKNRNEKRTILNRYIEAFRATLFRQTMFAEFEKRTHEAVEAGEVLTSDYLCAVYGGLNEKYFGKHVATDDLIRLEWSRIPHFYRAFYVYKYATGYSAATAISRRILEQGKPAVKHYIDFLKAGNSDDPIELLKIAGVDMGRPEPVEDAMAVFRGLVEELETLV